MDLVPLHYKALEDSASLFDEATATRTTEKSITLQRVHCKNVTPTQSIDATLPLHMKNQTLIHQRKNHSHKPIDNTTLDANQPNNFLTHTKKTFNKNCPT